MRYIVFSDSHGNRRLMEKILGREKFDGIIHLGDGMEEAGEIACCYPSAAFISVPGNCDGLFFGADETETVAETGGVRILVCHGHRYQVKSGTGFLWKRAKELGVRAAFFGHTHAQYLRDSGGILLLNPGSVRMGEYAAVEVADGRISAELKCL
ncbi:MAG: YfcE family phosphodiesterase [Clostridia bacterium]|nr:YfcE family phosphodiesterase [Clostridia bacterium]